VRVQPEPRASPRGLERRAAYAGGLFEGIDDAVLVHDSEGHILDANPAACRRLDYTREELLRLSMGEIEDPDFFADFAQRFRAHQGPGPTATEGRHLSKDGRPIPVEINTSAIEVEGQTVFLAVIRDISERKRAEQRLAAQYAVTRVLAEAATLQEATPQLLQAVCESMGWDTGAIWSVDQKGGVLRCVDLWHLPDVFFPEFEALTRGMTCMQGVGLPGRVWADAAPLWISDVTRDSNFPRAPAAALEGLHAGFAFPIRSGGETTGVLECFSQQVRGPDNDLLSLMAALGSQIGQFIERKQFEESLRDSEALYHSLVESLPQCIFRKDREGRVTFGNSRYCASLGKTLQELLGLTDYDLFPPHLAHKYRRDDQWVVDTGNIFETVEEHRLPDGTTLYVQVVKTPVRDAQGKITCTQGIFWDVTARKRAEEALSDSERRYRQLTEASLEAIIVGDRAGTIVLFNPMAERMFGYCAAEIVGQPLLRLIPGEFHQRHQQGFQRYLQTRQAFLIGRTVELRGRRKDGAEFPLELSLSAIDRGGELQFLGAIRDLTERNRMRDIVAQSEKLASIGLLSAGMAHEINNPLAYVANNLAVVERDSKGIMALLDLYEGARTALAQADPETAQRVQVLAEEIDLPYIRANLDRVLGRTHEGVRRVTKIVQSLRSLARTDRPRMESAFIPDLVDASLEMIRGRMERRGIELELDYHLKTKVPCVASQISQALFNLLVNALQTIEAADRGREGRIRIAASRTNGEVVIEVADNGCGIDPQVLPRIFDPFFTTKPVGEGTGMGLSISHSIVAGHGGRIEVDSRPGEGTCFRVFLPLEPQGSHA
jgi:PAS domain S-box-containing protein